MQIIFLQTTLHLHNIDIFIDLQLVTTYTYVHR